MRKTILVNVTFIVIKNAKLFNKVEYLQNEFKFLTEADKERFYSGISGHFSIIKRFPAFRHCFIKIGMLISKKIMLNYLKNVLLTYVL